MELGLVGLGRMGGNMRQRLRRGGHTVVGYARSPEGRDVDSLPALVDTLTAPRPVWLMMAAGDVVIDGGNSRWTDDAVNAELLGQRGIGYVDCGVSGGVWGLDNGYGLMAGGTTADIARLLPIFDTLRPEGPRDEGFAHAGPVGSGHFAKMVHNGIEYGLMQAYAEGFEL